MHRIDKLHTAFPFAGSRMLQGLLVQEVFAVERLNVATLMKRMGIEALFRKPNTSKPVPGHKIYPYLLRKLPVTRPNQVWIMDITYIPMARGFIYLAAVLDWVIRQDSQFTSAEFIKVRASREIKIRMDGKGAWRDNVFVERLWRTIKYEEVYLHAYANVPEARASIGRYISFYNGRRPHSSLDGKTPDQACFNPLTPELVAA
jgi:putative transposase